MTEIPFGRTSAGYNLESHINTNVKGAPEPPTILGPDVNPRTPKFKLPPGSCDCHAHVFGPQDVYPLAANHTYVPPIASTQMYVHMLRTIGCECGVLVQPSGYGTDNSAMLDALRSKAFDLRGIAVIDPVSITDDELSAMHEAGVRGLRLNLFSHGAAGIVEKAPLLAARIKPLGWHLQVFFDLQRTPDIGVELSKLSIDIVVDHFGHIDASRGTASREFQALLDLARRPNCWFKLMGPYRVSKQADPYPEVTPFVHALIETAPDRTVWATDWPHPNISSMPNDGALADLLMDWIPDERQRAKVLVDNPARLYGFVAR